MILKRPQTRDEWNRTGLWLRSLRAQLDCKEIAPPVAVGRFIHWALESSGIIWRASRRTLIADRGNLDPALSDLIKYRWRYVPEAAQLALIRWLSNPSSLELTYEIPSPMAMLKTQALGRRFVSLILDTERAYSAIGEHHDAFDFVIHDLIHAQRFWEDPLRQQGQVSIYQKLLSSLQLDPEICSGDAEFEKAFNYVVSDMNSHPVHMLLTLVAARRDYLNRTGRPLLQLETWWEHLIGGHECSPALFSLVRGHKPSQSSLNQIWTELRIPPQAMLGSGHADTQP